MASSLKTIAADKWNGLLQSRSVRSVLWLSGSTALAQGLVVAAAPLLTRIYSPEAFGLLMLLVSIASVAAVLASLRYEQAIPLPARDAVAANILALAVGLVLFTSAAAAILVWLLKSRLSHWLSAPLVESYYWALPLMLLLMGLQHVFTVWLVRFRAFKQVAAGKVVQSFAQVAGQLTLGMLSLGPLGLVAGETGGRAIGVGFLWRRWHAWAKLRRRITWRRMQAMAVRYRRFPLWGSWASGLGALAMWSPLVLLGACFDLHVVGCVALAQRVIGVPLALLANSVEGVYLQRCAEFNRSAPGRLPGLFRRVVVSQLLFSAATCLVVGLVAPWSFGLIFGAAWRDAGYFVLALLPLYLSRSVALTVAPTFNVMGRQDWHVLRELLRVAVVLAVFAAAPLLKISPLAAVAIYSAVTSALYAMGTLACWQAIRLRLAEGPTTT